MNETEITAKEIVDIAFQIHSQIGPGLLESIYEKCFIHELQSRNIKYSTQLYIDLNYKDMNLPNALKLDLIIDDTIIVELKARENYHPVWKAQLLSYLKFTQTQIGFIINFNVPLIKEGITRISYRP